MDDRRDEPGRHIDPAPAEEGRLMRVEKRIVSGIQPTGNLHLGNYLGAISRWVRMQDEAECLFFLADLHAITVYNDPAELAANVRAMAAALIACGIDPERSLLFNQARIPAHAELGWILSCTARIGWLNRMTQFKEKSGKNREGSSVGLYAYPVLQAADVLLYQATHVPVGDDQKQHVELIRDIAAKFNTDYAVDLFTLPEPLIGAHAARIMSLRDGNAKMSKSDPSDMSRINLTDDSDLVAQKIRKAKTDPEPLPDAMEGLEGRPEARNLVLIYAALAGREPAEILSEHAGKGFGAFKPVLAELTVETLRPIRARLDALRSDPGELDSILARGSEQAAALARPTLEGAYRALGLSR
jgi:tryptophanyl-tRNA synthetase